MTKQLARHPYLVVIFKNVRSRDDGRRRVDKHIYSYRDGTVEVRRAIETPRGQEPAHVPTTTQYE